MPQKKTLQQLANEANQHHAEVEGSLRASLESARQAGIALHAVKQQVAHGEWGQWLEANFKSSKETARVYMRIARKWNQLSEELIHRPNLSIDGALKALKGPHCKRQLELDSNRWEPPPRSEQAIRARKQLSMIFSQEISQWDDDEVIYMADQSWSSRELQSHLKKLRVRIERVAPTFVSGQNEPEEAFTKKLVSDTRRLPDLTGYEKEWIYRTVRGADWLKGRNKRVLLAHLITHEIESPQDWIL